MIHKNTIVGGRPTSAPAKNRELKTIAKGGSISLFGNLFWMLFALLFQIFMARTLGPAGVGLLSLGLSLIGIAVIFVLFGLHRSVVRFVAHYAGIGDQARTAGAIQSALRIFGGTVLLVTPLIWLGADFLARDVFNKPELGIVLRILALSIPFTALMQLLLAVAQAFKRVEHKSIIEQMVVPLLKICGAALAIYAFNFGLMGVVVAILFSAIVGALLSAISVWPLYPLRGENTKQERAVLPTRAMLAFSWPLWLTSLIGRLWNQTGILLLGAFATSEQIGIYHIGTRATIFIVIFLEALNSIFSPIISELYARNDKKSLSTMYQTITRWALTLSVPVFLLLFMFSTEIMAFFGPEFVVGSSVVRILALSQLIFIVTGPSGRILTMTDHPRFNLLNMFLTLVINLLLGFWLIPQYGAFGAAIVGAISITFINTLRLVEVYLLLHIQPYNLTYLKPLVAGLLAATITVLIGQLLPNWPAIWRLGSLGLILGLIYLLVLLALGLDENDQVIIQAVQQRFRAIYAKRGMIIGR